jgi:methionyl-tRNA formyltransferase
VRVFLSGRGAFAVHVAEAATATGHALTGVASPALKDGRTDEDSPLAWDRLRAWAYPRRIPWSDAAELRARHIPDGTEVIVAAHSRAFLGRATRDRAEVAAIGYHPSLLPLHRGRDAIRWTVRDRDRVTGGTVYHLTDRVDGGPIAAQDYVIVPPGATAESLWREHLAPLGVRLLLDTLDAFDAGVVPARAQDDRLATWEPSMDSAPLYKPELPELTAAVAPGGGGTAGPGSARTSRVHFSAVTSPVVRQSGHAPPAPATP